MIYHNAKDSNKSPSDLIGLIEGSYEAYCFDQVTWYAVRTISADVDTVGQKPVKGQAQKDAARDRRLKKLLGKEVSAKQFADPAALFQTNDK